MMCAPARPSIVFRRRRMFDGEGDAGLQGLGGAFKLDHDVLRDADAGDVFGDEAGGFGRGEQADAGEDVAAAMQAYAADLFHEELEGGHVIDQLGHDELRAGIDLLLRRWTRAPAGGAKGFSTAPI